ncbi:hypothetical protein ACJIZ3_015012 [Penstemon smallii]|uniref:PB1 domain-containing protein n=1 Tax=Penstemon smallii TaxID=265156 RepID=A0ABD3RL94_9LAMI
MEKQTSNLTINNGSKVKLLCSYGGKIQPRPTDHQLTYVGGDTKILAVDRTVKFSEIAFKLNSLCNRNGNFEISVKYQLPGEDLDALVSLIDDEDVEHMMLEYDRMQKISAKPSRLRLFVFDISGPLPVKSGVKEPGLGTNSNPDYLFGFDKEYNPSVGPPPLDLLQIPGMVLPENYAWLPRDGVERVTGRVNNVSLNGANGGGYQTGHFVYGMVAGMGPGNPEQAVYNFVPVMPLVPEQRMMVPTGNNLEVKVNQSNF